MVLTFNPEISAIKRPVKKKKPLEPSEYYEQLKTVVYLQKKNIPVFAIPNGGSRHMLEAVKLKKSGVSPGVPDLMVPVARHGFHGMFLELKRIGKAGTVSDNQRWWIGVLQAQGYRCEVCAGFEAAKAVIDEYFS